MRAVLLLPMLVPLLGASCAHQIVQQPVACITQPVTRDPKHVTNEQLKRINPDKHPDRFISLAGARIVQDEGYIAKLEAQVDGCSKLTPSAPVPVPVL